MALTLITGPANCGKARAVLDAVRAHAARVREPLLVVPTANDVERYRRELAQDGLVFGVRVERFAGLIDAIAAATGRGQPALSPLARERVVAAVAARTPLRTLGQAASTPGFQRALTGLIAQLGSERVSAARFAAAMREWPAQDGARAGFAADLRALYDGYERALARLGRTDAERRATAALDALGREPACWRGRPVCLYGFDDMTALQLDAIDTLARIVGAPVTVSLAYEAGRDAFAGRATTFQTLLPLAAEHVALAPRADHYAPAARGALHHLERSLFEEGRFDGGVASDVDPGGAVRLLEGGGERAELELVAGEISALLADGVPAGEIAIALRPAGADPALLHEVLAAYGIPCSHRRPVRFAETGVGRGLLALLRCALTDADAADLLAWLRTPGLLERPELADRLEAQVLMRGVAGADAARALWEEGNWPLDALTRLRDASRRGPVALLEQASAELARLFAAPRRRAAAVLAADELDEARAVAACAAALAELAVLAAAAPDLGVDGPGLIELLDALELLAGEPAGERAVTIADPLALRARRVRALFVCGLQEGVLPAAPGAQPLLGEAARGDLARASGLVLTPRTDNLAAERYLFYAAASRPTEWLYLSWHAADDDGAPMSPSLFVDDVCDLFDAGLRTLRRRRPLGAADWPGPGAPAARARAREHALTGPRRSPAPIAPLRDPRVLALLADEQRVWSASAMEVYAGCPTRWLVERLLRVQGLEGDPEPMARGALAHAVLEATLRALRERAGSARLTPQRVGLARVLARAALAELEGAHPLSSAPERVPGARRRLAADLERYLEYAADTASPLEPRHLELGFGLHDSELPALDLGDGVRVRGRIDRVDVSEDGAAVVYDYKGKSAPEPARWLSDGRFQLAVYMDVAQRLLQLHTVGGFYQPLGTADLRGRGLLAGEAHLDLPHVNGDEREQACVQELVQETLAAARAAALTARTGHLAARPSGCGWGGRCEHPTFCRCEG